jgi:hypothetical protein
MSRILNTGLNIVTDGWMFRNLSRRLEETPSIWFTSLAKKNDRKQVAQKFYSLLVLQKVKQQQPRVAQIFSDLKGLSHKTDLAFGDLKSVKNGPVTDLGLEQSLNFFRLKGTVSRDGFGF